MQSVILHLELGLRQYFVDKNKHIKKYVVVEFETLCSSKDNDISPDDKENFHELLRSATNTFTQKVYRTKDKTYSVLNLYKKIKTLFYFLVIRIHL